MSLMTTILFDSWDSGGFKKWLVTLGFTSGDGQILSPVTNKLCFSLSHYYHKEIKIENFSTEVKHVPVE